MIFLGNQAVGVAAFNGLPTNIPKVDDNNAYVYLYLPNADDLGVRIYIVSSGASSGTYNVTWGDGTSETAGNSNYIEHTFSDSGVYTVKLVITSGTPKLGGSGNTLLIGGSSAQERPQAAKLIGLETGTWGVYSNQFTAYSNVVAIYAKKASYLGYNAIVSAGAKLLRTIEMPDITTKLTNSNFQECYSLGSVTIPTAVTSLGSAFTSCGKLSIHMLASSPPTLTSSSAFNNTDITIYVPTGSLSAYQAAENWSAYADKMVEE